MTSRSVQPIFILSLPRSGSTLLQRLLLSSGECATLGEASLMLRFLGHDELISRKATYWEFLVDIAMIDMRAQWPDFDAAYASGVRQMMSKIYAGLAEGKRYFVDKTPRYTLIAEEIYKVFPDAKYLVLWRHPLAVASSMSASSRRGYWFPDEYAIDLHAGLSRLQDFATRHADEICQVRYEDLVTDQTSVLRTIAAYLDLTCLTDVADKTLPTSAGGGLGDSTGTRKYSKISDRSLTSWHGQIDNWYRRRWVRRYCRGRVAAIMQEHGYGTEDVLSNGPHPVGLWSGLKDLLFAGHRRHRRLKKPLQVAREVARLRGQHGFDIVFR
jgi:hypothetical protein